MDEDDLLAMSVGAVMKEEDGAMEVRLEKYARGELSDAERAELQSRADDDPYLRQALELHAPLSSELKSRLTKMGSEASRPANVVPLRSRRTAIGAMLAIAAAAALFGLFYLKPKNGALPSYILSARAGDAMLRSGEAPKSNRLRADSEIELILRPATPIDPSQLETALYAGGDRVVVTPEVSEDGAVRWIGRADVFSASRTGIIGLTVIVGLKGTLPSLQHALAVRSGATWQADRIEVEIAPLGDVP